MALLFQLGFSKSFEVQLHIQQFRYIISILLRSVLLWAPFLNFRKFPRDPNMKYPWSTPEDPDQVKAGFLKYPFAEPEDYS